MNQLLEHKDKVVTALEDSYASIVGSFLMEPRLNTLKITINQINDDSQTFNQADDIYINDWPVIDDEYELEQLADNDEDNGEKNGIHRCVYEIIEDLLFLYQGEDGIEIELNREQLLTL